MFMTRRKGDINTTRFKCYVYDGTSERGPVYAGVKYGKVIAFKEFAQRDAALRWLNNPTRRLLPRVLSRHQLDVISGMWTGCGGGQWSANITATL